MYFGIVCIGYIRDVWIVREQRHHIVEFLLGVYGDCQLEWLEGHWSMSAGDGFHITYPIMSDSMVSLQFGQVKSKVRLSNWSLRMRDTPTSFALNSDVQSSQCTNQTVFGDVGIDSFVQKFQKGIRNVQKDRSGFSHTKIPQDFPQFSPKSQRMSQNYCLLVTFCEGMS